MKNLLLVGMCIFGMQAFAQEPPMAITMRGHFNPDRIDIGHDFDYAPISIDRYKEVTTQMLGGTLEGIYASLERTKGVSKLQYSPIVDGQKLEYAIGFDYQGERIVFEAGISEALDTPYRPSSESLKFPHTNAGVLLVDGDFPQPAHMGIEIKTVKAHKASVLKPILTRLNLPDSPFRKRLVVNNLYEFNGDFFDSNQFVTLDFKMFEKAPKDLDLNNPKDVKILQDGAKKMSVFFDRIHDEEMRNKLRDVSGFDSEGAPFFGRKDNHAIFDLKNRARNFADVYAIDTQRYVNKTEIRQRLLDFTESTPYVDVFRQFRTIDVGGIYETGTISVRFADMGKAHMIGDWVKLAMDFTNGAEEYEVDKKVIRSIVKKMKNNLRAGIDSPELTAALKKMQSKSSAHQKFVKTSVYSRIAQDKKLTKKLAVNRKANKSFGGLSRLNTILNLGSASWDALSMFFAYEDTMNFGLYNCPKSEKELGGVYCRHIPKSFTEAITGLFSNEDANIACVDIKKVYTYSVGGVVGCQIKSDVISFTSSDGEKLESLLDKRLFESAGDAVSNSIKLQTILEAKGVRFENMTTETLSSPTQRSLDEALINGQVKMAL